jgi:glyoxylase-like metal-dependent hydrolase (beta-lactamase superfamily II)
MNLQPFFSDGISSNIYLIAGEKRLLVDAGMEPTGVNDVDILVLTHSHFDHSAMAKDIQDKTGCEIWMSQEEADFFKENRREASAAKYFDFNVDLDFKIGKTLKDGEEIDLDGVTLQALVTPGHTPGGLCLYEQDSKTLFSGDTVFAQGFGRYDLLGGDLQGLRISLNRLSELDVKELYPGHGPALKQGVNEYLSSITV